MKQITPEVTPITSESQLETQLEISREMLKEVYNENDKLRLANFELQRQLHKHTRHFAAIAVEAMTRVLVVASVFGLLASFLRPEQLENAVFFGSILGLGLYFAGYEIDI